MIYASRGYGQSHGPCGRRGASLRGLDVGKRDVAVGERPPVDITLVVRDIDATHAVPDRRELEFIAIGE